VRLIPASSNPKIKPTQPANYFSGTTIYRHGKNGMIAQAGLKAAHRRHENSAHQGGKAANPDSGRSWRRKAGDVGQKHPSQGG
jgi:hypothetical protein